MAKPGLWNDNRFRAYPFLRGSVGVDGAGTIANLPNFVIVDVGFTMSLDSGYVAGDHSVWLAEVRRSGTTITFQFESDAPGLIGKPITFTRMVTDDDYAIEYVDRLVGEIDSDASESASLSASLSESTSLSESSSFSYSGDEECDVQPLWSGFLVTGSLLDFDIVNGTTWEGAPANVEPATVVSLVGSYISNISLGNADRTRVTAAENCPDIDWDYPVGDDVIHIRQTCLQGNVKFKPGYNTEIEQIDDENRIVITADVGSGEGALCDTLELFDQETPPAGSTLYEGGPRCNEVLRSINGLGGQLLTLLDGTGTSITEVPEENKIIVDIDMRGLAICYTDISEVSESV